MTTLLLMTAKMMLLTCFLAAIFVVVYAILALTHDVLSRRDDDNKPNEPD